MNTDTKFSIKEAFKSAFKIYGQNFFVVLFLSVFSVIFEGALNNLILAYMGSTAESLNVFKTLDKLSPHNQLLFYCVSFFSENLVSFLLVSAFLPAFEGSKIKFRNYFPNFKKVFKALLVIIALTAVPLVISVSEVLVFGSNSFPNFLVKHMSLFGMMVSVLLGMLVFFYIEIVSGKSLLQFIRNIQEPSSKAILFFILLGFINSIPLLISLIAKSSTLLNLTLILLPLSILALISVYTQIVSSKANTQKMSLEIEDNIRLK